MWTFSNYKHDVEQDREPHPLDDDWLAWKTEPNSTGQRNPYRTASRKYMEDAAATLERNEALQNCIERGETEMIHELLTQHVNQLLRAIHCPLHWKYDLRSIGMLTALKYAQESAHYTLMDLHRPIHNAFFAFLKQEVRWHEHHTTGNGAPEPLDPFDEVAALEDEEAATYVRKLLEKDKHGILFLRNEVDGESQARIAGEECTKDNIRQKILKARQNIHGDAMLQKLFESVGDIFASDEEQKRILELQRPLISPKEHTWPVGKRDIADALRRASVERIASILVRKRGKNMCKEKDRGVAFVALARAGSRALPYLHKKFEADLPIQQFAKMADVALGLIAQLPDSERTAEPELPVDAGQLQLRIQSLQRRTRFKQN